MKFVVDCMLGKLAKWLKILGFDVVYDHKAEDSELLNIARKQARILLTRDVRLLGGAKDIPGLFIESEKWQEQVEQVLKKLNLRPHAKPYSRCIQCNVELKNLPKGKAKNLVAPFIFEHAASFADVIQKHPGRRGRQRVERLVSPAPQGLYPCEDILLCLLPEPLHGRQLSRPGSGFQGVHRGDLQFLEEHPDLLRTKSLYPEHIQDAVGDSLPDFSVVFRFPCLHEIGDDPGDPFTDAFHIPDRAGLDRSGDVVSKPLERPGCVVKGPGLERVGALQFEQSAHFLKYV